jgi:hypothetical protein
VGKGYVQISVYVSFSGGFTIRERGNSDLAYQLENRGFQGLFQNGSGANVASHTVGTVDIFPHFKSAETREQPLRLFLRFRISVTVPLHLRDRFT